MARRKFRTSEWVLLFCLGVGAAAAFGWWWVWPGSHWGWLLFLGLVIAGALYDSMIKQLAAQRLVDRDFDPDNPR